MPFSGNHLCSTSWWLGLLRNEIQAKEVPPRAHDSNLLSVVHARTESAATMPSQATHQASPSRSTARFAQLHPRSSLLASSASGSKAAYWNPAHQSYHAGSLQLYRRPEQPACPPSAERLAERLPIASPHDNHVQSSRRRTDTATTRTYEPWPPPMSAAERYDVQ